MNTNDNKQEQYLYLVQQTELKRIELAKLQRASNALRDEIKDLEDTMRPLRAELTEVKVTR